MNLLLTKGAETITMFCRLNVNIKRDLPIRSSEMGLLLLVVKSETPVTPVHAASFFGVSKPMIANMTASLIQQGYLTKTPSAQDRRSFMLTPTPKALELAESAYAEYCKVMQALHEKMGEAQYATLVGLLEQANGIIADMESDEAIRGSKSDG